MMGNIVAALLASVAVATVDKWISGTNPNSQSPNHGSHKGHFVRGHKGAITSSPTPSTLIDGSDLEDDYDYEVSGVVGYAGVNVTGCGLNYCAPLIYNEGVVISNPTVYVMWYGNWDSASVNLIQNFFQNLGSSSWYQMLSFYPWGSPPTGLTWGGSVVHAPAGYATALSDEAIESLIMNEPTWSTKNPNGIYFVLSSADVNATSGFCETYCSFHGSTYGPSSTFPTYFAWAGDASALCPNKCFSLPKPNPNGAALAGADSLVSFIAHEIAEAITDSDSSGYKSITGNENADICGWTYGTLSTNANGGKYNTVIGGTQYVVQQLVDYRNVQVQTCGMAHSALPPTPQGSATCATALPIGVGSQTAQTNMGLGAANAPMTTACTMNGVDAVMYYQLTVPSYPAVCSVDTCIGDFDSVVAVYSSCGATSAITCNDNSATCSPQSNVTWTATQSTYIIGVGSVFGANQGTFTLHVTCGTAPPSTSQPTQNPSRPTATPTANPTMPPSAAQGTARPTTKFPTKKPTPLPPTPKPTPQPPTPKPTRANRFG